MNFIIIIAGVVISCVWGYYTYLRRKLRSHLHFALTILVTLAGFCLFQLYGYGMLKMLRYLILLNGILLISCVDCREKIISNKTLIYLLGIRTLILIAEGISNRHTEYLKEIIISPFLGFFIGGALFFLCYFLSRNGLGAGDVKLFATIGFYVGAGTLFPVMFLSALFSAAYGIIMVALHKIQMKDTMPFGPFAAAGTMVTLLLGF